jgi:hypothetical protein
LSSGSQGIQEKDLSYFLSDALFSAPDITQYPLLEIINQQSKICNQKISNQKSSIQNRGINAH